LEFDETRVPPRARTRYLNEYDFKSLQSVNTHVCIPRMTNTIIPTASTNDKREKNILEQCGHESTQPTFMHAIHIRIRVDFVKPYEMKNVRNIVETLTHDRGVFEDKKTTSRRMLYLLTSHSSRRLRMIDDSLEITSNFLLEFNTAVQTLLKRTI